MVISGCVNGQGTLKVRTTKAYEESTVARILEMVETATEKKTRVENFVTRFAHVYTPIVTIGALVLALVPPLVLGGGLDVWVSWIRRACIFLVVSCPCALVISVPLGFFGGIGAASRIGVLVKGSNYLEALSQVRTIVFDKTGTLTKGEFKVSSMLFWNWRYAPSIIPHTRLRNRSGQRTAGRSMQRASARWKRLQAMESGPLRTDERSWPEMRN